MKMVFRIIMLLICFILASVYIYPIFSGLILLPLDLLVSHSNPWLLANTILLKNSYMQDSIIQMFPWKHLTFSSIISGQIPLWNPYQFLGMPFMASMKPLVFYPGNILFIFGEVNAWNWLLLSQLFLALLFTYLFLRSIGIERIAALFSGIAFSFCSLMVSVLEFGSEGHVLLWIPLLLYAVKRFYDTSAKRNLLIMVFAFASSIFAGHFQYLAYGCLLIIAFALYEANIQKDFKKLLWICGAFLFGFGIAAIQLLPGIELYQYSHRGLTDGYAIFANGLLKPFHLFRLLSPDWFGNPTSMDLRIGYIETSGYFGIIPLFFTIYAIWSERKNQYVRFFTTVFISSILLSMDHIGQIIYYLRIPVITGGYGGRIFSMTLLSGAVLAGIGLSGFSKLTEGKKIRQLAIGYFFITLFIVGIGVFGKSLHVPFALTLTNCKYQLAFLTLFTFGVVIASFVRKNNYVKTACVIAIIILTYLDLFRMRYRFLTFSNPKFLYPTTPIISYVKNKTLQTLGRTYGVTEPEIHTALGISSIETYNPMYPMRTAQFLQMLEHKTKTPLANKYYVTPGESLKFIFDFLGVEYVAVVKGVNPSITYFKTAQWQNDFEKVFEDDKHDVYKNKTAYLRYALFYDVQGAVSDEKVLDAIQNKTYDFQKTVLIREPVENVASGTGTVKIISSDINRQKFNAVSTAPAIFYVSDANFPGWHATVNGKETPILTANYIFRAIKIPEGESEIEFWYYPQSVKIGMIVSVSSLGAVCLLFLTFLFVKKGNKDKHSTSHKRNR